MKKDYNRTQQDTYKALKKMMLRGGGMENMLMCLTDIIEDMIKECDDRVKAGTASIPDTDIEYLRILHCNLSKTYGDYFRRNDDAQALVTMTTDDDGNVLSWIDHEGKDIKKKPYCACSAPSCDICHGG